MRRPMRMRGVRGEVREAHEGHGARPTDLKLLEKVVAQLDDREGGMPELVDRPLRRRARAEQVDGAEEAGAVALLLPLDAIVPRVPRPAQAQ